MAIDIEIEKGVQLWKDLIKNGGLSPEDQIALKYGTIVDIIRIANRLGIEQNPDSLLQAREDFMTSQEGPKGSTESSETENKTEKEQKKTHRQKPDQQHLHPHDEPLDEPIESEARPRKEQQVRIIASTPQSSSTPRRSVLLGSSTVFTRPTPATTITYSPRREGLVDRANTIGRKSRGLRRRSPVGKLKKTVVKKVAIWIAAPALIIILPILFLIFVVMIITGKASTDPNFAAQNNLSYLYPTTTPAPVLQPPGVAPDVPGLRYEIKGPSTIEIGTPLKYTIKATYYPNEANAIPFEKLSITDRLPCLPAPFSVCATIDPRGTEGTYTKVGNSGINWVLSKNVIPCDRDKTLKCFKADITLSSGFANVLASLKIVNKIVVEIAP